MDRFSTPLRVSLLYLVFAGAWILATDYLLAWVAGMPIQFSLLQSLKGGTFVLGTSLLLYLFLRRRVPLDAPARPVPAPRAPLPLLVFAVTAAALIGTGYSTYLSLQTQERSEVHDRLKSVGELKVRQINQWLLERRRDMELLSRDSDLARDLQAWSRDPASRPDFPTRLAERFSTLGSAYGFSAMVLFDAQGSALWASDEHLLEGQDAEARRGVLRALNSGAMQLVDLHYHGSISEGHVVMGYVSPLSVGEGPAATPVGALYLVADARHYLFPLVQDWPLPSASGETLIVRREGERVRFLNTLRHGPALALTQTRALDDPLLPAARALRGELGVVTDGVDYRGMQVLAFAAAIPDTSWVMVAKVDAAEIYAPLAGVASVATLATLLLVLAAAAVVAVWWRGQIGRHQVQLLDQELQRQALVRHFDYLAKYANDIILLWDESTRIVEANDRAVDAFGYSREELVGLPMADLYPPMARPAFDRLLARLRHSDRLMLESVHQRKDGSTIPVEASIRRMRHEGRILYQCILRDISERKQAEARILRLSRLYHTLSEANQAIIRAVDENALFKMVCWVAVEHGEFELAWVGMPEPRTGKLRAVASHGPARSYLRGLEIRLDGNDPLGQGPTAAALLQDRPQFCNDFLHARETAPWHERALEHGIAASAALPLHRRGEVAAVLSLYAADTGAFDGEIQNLVKEMATDLSYALDRFQDQRELVAERDRAQGYLNVAGVILVALDLQGRVTLINRKGLSLLGYAEETQVVGRHWFEDFLPPAHRRQVSGVFQRLTRGELEGYFENPLLTRGGEERLIAWHNAVLRDAQGMVSGILSSGEDITERKAAERALAHSRALLESLINSIPDLIFYKDTGSVYLGCNRAFAVFANRPPEELVGRTDFDLVDAKLASFFREHDQIMLASGKPRRNEEMVTYPDGRQVLLETLKTPYYGPSGELLGLIGISRDITARKQAEDRIKRSEDSLNRAKAVAHVGSWSLGFAADTSEWSAETYRIFGMEPGEPLQAGSFFSRLHPEDQERVQAAWEQAQTTGQLDVECRIQARNRTKWVDIRAELEFDDAGQARTAVGTLQDITDRKAAEESVMYLAHYDALTGLPNRQLLEDRLEYAISIMARRKHAPVAVLFLDLDRFKNINDSLGHRMGDLLLRKVGERLQTSLRAEDTVARTGGDEFTVVLPDTGEQGAAVVAEKITDALGQAFDIEGRSLSISSSIGIAMYPDNGEDVDALVRSADTAMYRAKKSGGGAYHFFTQEMHLTAVRRLELETGLRTALRTEGFSVHYQVQVEAASGMIIGAEALARWRHAQWGQVPPSEFIPVAEESGLILPLGEWILDQAIAQARAWQQPGGPAVTVAVNLSVVQLRQRDFVDTVDRLLTRHGLAPHLLELEVTESIAMLEAEFAVDLMSRLHARGITLSIDDFGTGYSSLSYLKRFNASKLKIDASFVRGLPEDENDAAIATTIIRMGHSLGLKILAEGVETTEQAAFLREQGCDYLQGYLFGRPAPAVDLSDVLAAGKIVP